MRLPLLPLIGTAAIVAAPAAAQRVQVHGVAFDSLHAEPLKGATVTLAGQTTVADGRGRFTFDTVAPGTRTIIVYHAVLDTIGLGAISARVEVTDGRQEVRVAVPSFAT